jgi:hypothetical protein
MRWIAAQSLHLASLASSTGRCIRMQFEAQPLCTVDIEPGQAPRLMARPTTDRWFKERLTKDED